jgi:hypothetical protein
MREKWLLSSLGSVMAMFAMASVWMGACSATGGAGTDGSGAANSNGSGSNGSGGDGNGFIGGGGSGNSGSTGACAATVNKAEQVPLGMYLMIDKSRSSISPLRRGLASGCNTSRSKMGWPVAYFARRKPIAALQDVVRARSCQGLAGCAPHRVRGSATSPNMPNRR